MTFQLESGAPFCRIVCIRCAAAAKECFIVSTYAVRSAARLVRWSCADAAVADGGSASRSTAGTRRVLSVSAAAKDLEKISGSGAKGKDGPDFGAPKIEAGTTG